MSSVLAQQILHGPTALWRRCTAVFRAAVLSQDARSGRRIAFTLSIFAGLALLGAFWGSAVAVAELNALYLCVSLIGCVRSEEHTSELQSLAYLVCRLLLEKKKKISRKCRLLNYSSTIRNTPLDAHI